MEAFSLARRIGVPGVELDVQQSEDGDLVVFHDGDLRRLAEIDQRIADLPTGDLATVSLSDSARGWVTTGIPTLDDVIDALDDTTYVDIEIKSYADTPPTVSDLVAECIARRGIADRVVVSSFDPRRIRRFRRAFRETMPDSPPPLCATIYSRTPELPWFLRYGGGRYVGGGAVRKPRWSDIPAGRRLTALQLVWTVNDATVAGRLRRDGAAGLIGDDPQMLLSVVTDDPSAPPG